MAERITSDAAGFVLEPLLGSRFVRVTRLDERVAVLLEECLNRRLSLEAAHQTLYEGIFDSMYASLGKKMLLPLEDGGMLRITLDDVHVLADEALGVLLDALPPAALPLDTLRAYAMDNGSLSAMRHMLMWYDARLAPVEKEMLSRVISENAPVVRRS